MSQFTSQVEYSTSSESESSLIKNKRSGYLDRLANTFHSLLTQTDSNTARDRKQVAPSGYSNYRCNIDASELSQRDIYKWFEPLTQSGVTAPFGDEDESTLITSILRQVSVEEECVRTEEELQVILNGQVPALVRNQCDSVSNLLWPALNNVQNRSTSSEDFYITLWRELYDLRVSSTDLADYAAGSRVLQSMFNLADLFVRPPVCDSTDIVHRAWAELLMEIFQLVIGTKPEHSAGTIKEPLLQQSGLSKFMLKLPDLNNRPQFATSRPNLLVEMQHLGMNERRVIKDVILCVAEVKSQKNRATNGHDYTVDGSSESSDDDCEEPGVDKHSTNEIISLKTQHFLQLLSCIAPMNLTIGPQKKFCPMKNAFGLYMDGFKIYPTSLNPVHVCQEIVENKPEQKLQCTNDYWFGKFIGQETPGVSMETAEKGPIHLYMAFSGYLNVFNPLHFKVLLRYLQVLVWHDKMHTTVSF